MIITIIVIIAIIVIAMINIRHLFCAQACKGDLAMLREFTIRAFECGDFL